jgi:predicted nucleic acid-binding protein
VAGVGVILDACVLVPHVVMDSLLSLAEEDLYQPMWSDVILDETLRALKALYPDKNPQSFETRLASMCSAFPNARMQGWQELETDLRSYWPDPDDAHVVAAAIKGQAKLIVTNNRKDFPETLLATLGLRVATPDEFLSELLELNEKTVLHAISRQAERTNIPVLSVLDIAQRLSRVAPDFANSLLLRFNPESK